ncbi:hypothetical protein ACLOJK_019918 [Asimina triloba]
MATGYILPQPLKRSRRITSRSLNTRACVVRFVGALEEGASGTNIHRKRFPANHHNFGRIFQYAQRRLELRDSESGTLCHQNIPNPLRSGPPDPILTRRGGFEFVRAAAATACDGCRGLCRPSLRTNRIIRSVHQFPNLKTHQYAKNWGMG